MYAMSLAQGDSNVQYRRKKVQSKPSWNHLEEIKNIKKKLQFQIFIYIFMVLSNLQTETKQHIWKIYTSQEPNIGTFIFFCPRNGCYQQKVLFCIYWLTYAAVFLWLYDFWSRLAEFGSSQIFSVTCFYEQNIMKRAGGGRDSFTEAKSLQPFITARCIGDS